MIYTVTLNPCIDRTVTVSDFKIGETNRSLGYEKNICGKGINTSVALRNLGYDSEAIIFDYKDGDSVPSFLKSNGIKSHTVKVPGELRVNVKIFDKNSQTITEINESGTPVDEEAVVKMKTLIDSKLKSGDFLVLSGSVPPGIPDTFYEETINSAKSKGVKTILDADKTLLVNGLRACPNLIKPNVEELERLTGFKHPSVPEIVKVAKQLYGKGIENVCVSMGKEGSLFFSEGKAFRAVNRIETVEGTVGAGDSMIAGFIMAMTEKKGAEDMIRYASAVAAGSCSLPSTNMCTNELFHEMLANVDLMYL